MTANKIRYQRVLMPCETTAPTIINKQLIIERTGQIKRFMKPRVFSLVISITKIGIYIAYSVIIGSSDESKPKVPNQLLEVRFAPKKKTNQRSEKSRPIIEEFVGILVLGLISFIILGFGPWFLTAME